MQIINTSSLKDKAFVIKYTPETGLQLDVVSLREKGVLEMYEKLSDTVSRVQERLDAPNAIFRDSLIEKVGRTTEWIGQLNIGGDGFLDKLRKDIEKKIASINPDEIRRDPVLRKQVAADCEVLLDSISKGIRKTKGLILQQKLAEKRGQQ